uniref:Uncharacterized protein n=1 Tax=Rhizophora mucronata TaxID=61149 RepID=A0A2P2P110_RHIMU
MKTTSKGRITSKKQDKLHFMRQDCSKSMLLVFKTLQNQKECSCRNVKTQIKKEN